MNNRMAVSKLNETATRTKLESLGNTVERYGQELLSDAARALIRGAPTLDRWLPDFLVKTNAGTTVLVDSKYSYPKNANHSIEMRALLAAHREGLPVWYVCSFASNAPGKFHGYKAINAVAVPTTRPCCAGCLTAWHSSPDALTVNYNIPDRCPKARSESGSGTPWFVVNFDAFPITGDPFGILPPTPQLQRCRECGGLVPPGGKWADVHPACHQWPETGQRYGGAA